MRPFVILLAFSGVVSSGTAGTIFRRQASASLMAPSHRHQRFALSNFPHLNVRGGSIRILSDEEDDDKDEEEEQVDPEEEKRRLALQKWVMDQQILMQLRSTFLSEALAKRGIPIATIADVSTSEGDKPPEKVDWDCAMSTLDEPKPCLYSFDAEPNTKVVAPIDTTQWITLSALNRLRRTDPTKVEPMWHSQYAVLSSWFGDDSEFSILQHVGMQGFLLSLLLDSKFLLKGVLATGILAIGIIFLPIIEFMVTRFLVSGLFWLRWPTWGRIVHAALPLKLLLGQLAWKFLASSFGILENRVRDYIVDMECDMLEDSVPLTVGPGSEDEIVGEWVDQDGDVFVDAVEVMGDDDDDDDDEGESDESEA